MGIGIWSVKLYNNLGHGIAFYTPQMRLSSQFTSAILYFTNLYRLVTELVAYDES